MAGIFGVAVLVEERNARDDQEAGSDSIANCNDLTARSAA
jgi:hypothetical protein